MVKPKNNDIVILCITQYHDVMTEIPTIYNRGVYVYFHNNNGFSDTIADNRFPKRNYYWRYLTPLESITITQD